MLYLGKSRGRNCYSVYDPEKHKNVEIKKLANPGVFSSMQRLRAAADGAEGFEEKLRAVAPLLAEGLQLSELYYVGSDGKLRAVSNNDVMGEASDIVGLMEEDMFYDNTSERMEKNAVLSGGTAGGMRTLQRQRSPERRLRR